jgi:hypothetical protein
MSTRCRSHGDWRFSVYGTRDYKFEQAYACLCLSSIYPTSKRGREGGREGLGRGGGEEREGEKLESVENLGFMVEGEKPGAD